MAALLYSDYRLRPMKEEDLPAVLEWRNSDRIRRVSHNDNKISLEDHRAWFSRISDQKTGHSFIFENGRGPLGVVNISDIDSVNKRARWGFYLGVEKLPRGLGKVMGFQALEFVFEKLGLEKLCAEVLAFNTRGVEFHKFLGFIEEGRLAKQIFRDNHWWDVILMAHFKTTWEKRKKAIAESLFSDRTIQ